MDKMEAWKLFEKTGSIYDYINYKDLLYLDDEEDYPYGFDNQRSYTQAAPYRRTGQNHYHSFR